MPRIRNIFFIIIFIFWIIPLGVFIKATDEQKVCGGQRAICLCSHVIKSQGTGGKPIVVAHAGSPEKESNTFSGGNFFLKLGMHHEQCLACSDLSQNPLGIYSLVFVKSVDHVPKV